jgi:3-deoxy-D-manno-octulosonate 8-phosphate phosphatase KdsC-like HAD superfamily phosphatase
MSTEDLYMRSIVSKRQAEVTRARAEASKIKLAFMKELREHGISLEEIEQKTAIKFPPLADMADGLGDDSEVDSDAYE